MKSGGDKRTYEGFYERDFLFRVAMPVSRCSPCLHTCWRDSAPHLRASPGLARPLQSDRKAQKLNVLVPRFTATRESVSGAPSRHLIILHRLKLMLSSFVATSFTTTWGKQTAPRPRSALHLALGRLPAMDHGPEGRAAGMNTTKTAKTSKL